MSPWRQFAAVAIAATAVAAVPLSGAGGDEPTDKAVTDPPGHYEEVPSPPPAEYMEPPVCTPGYKCGNSGHGDVTAPS